jgi:hypothetical protein
MVIIWKAPHSRCKQMQSTAVMPPKPSPFRGYDSEGECSDWLPGPPEAFWSDTHWVVVMVAGGLNVNGEVLDGVQWVPSSKRWEAVEGKRAPFEFVSLGEEWRYLG